MNYEEAKNYIYNEIRLENSNCLEILVDIAGKLDQDGIEFIQGLTNCSDNDAIQIWDELKKDYGTRKTNSFIPNLTPQQIAQANAQAREALNKPKCPTCGSLNVEKISTGKKVFGVAMFGLFSSDVRNTMHCKNCGYKW